MTYKNLDTSRMTMNSAVFSPDDWSRQQQLGDTRTPRDVTTYCTMTLTSDSEQRHDISWWRHDIR